MKVIEARLISTEEVNEGLSTPPQVCEIHVINGTKPCEEIQERENLDEGELET